MSETLTLVLATKNKHKIQEIKKILNLDIAYRTLSEHINIEVQEAGRTLLENSIAKAAFVYKVLSHPCLADDSGLFVDILGGEPGVFSARYGKDDEHRISRLLKQLEGQEKRSAMFKAVFTFYYDAGKYEVFEGNCPGSIAHNPRGTSGFGYDPIFIPDGYEYSFAELGQDVKNRISHRAKALEKFKKYIIAHYF